MTEIKYSFDRTAAVILSLYDFSGRAVAEFERGVMQSGYHNLTIDASELPSGIYVARLQASAEIRTAKLVCIKQAEFH